MNASKPSKHVKIDWTNALRGIKRVPQWSHIGSRVYSLQRHSDFSFGTIICGSGLPIRTHNISLVRIEGSHYASNFLATRTGSLWSL